MIKVDNIDVFNFEGAIRGMRNPLNSWDKSDSYNNHCVEYKEDGEEVHHPYYRVGATDLSLMKRLYKAGTEHRKFMRQIIVSMDITAPLYWWKEFDQYKIGVTTDSCSTMHTIHKKKFELGDFSYEHLENFYGDSKALFLKFFCNTVEKLNAARQLYLSTGDKIYWWQMIQLLPSSYNQKRTVTLNYENAVNIIQQRKNHKLDEWREFCEILLQELPNLKDIMESEE